MSQISSNLVAHLRRVSAELAALLEAIDNGQDVGSSALRQLPGVQEKLDEKICLRCGKKVVKPEQYRRGLCAKHYTTTDRKIKSGDWNEQRLIDKGMIALQRKPGAQTNELEIPTLEEDRKDIRGKLEKALDKKPKKTGA